MVADYAFEVEIPEGAKFDGHEIKWRLPLLKVIFTDICNSANSSTETKGRFPVPSDEELNALNKTVYITDLK